MDDTGKAAPSVSVLFVCLGNICKLLHCCLDISHNIYILTPPSGRSPMAEAVFHSLTYPNPQVTNVDSAGTGAYHVGANPDPRTMATLASNGINDYRHAARLVKLDDFAHFDYILAMDRENLGNLQRLKDKWLEKNGGEEGKSKVMLFGDFGGHSGEEVVDPYYGARNGFDVAHEQMVRFSNGFIKQVLG